LPRWCGGKTGKCEVVVNRRARGDLGEDIASAFLAVKGYTILDKKVRYARREVDILALRADVLVAVEVKLRRGTRFGSAAEAIDNRKLARIRVALEGISRAMGTHLAARIDVVAIDIEEDMSSMVVRHIEGAGT
jgi:putative endonuclease